MPFEKPRLFSGDGEPEAAQRNAAEEITAKALRSQVSLPCETASDDELGLSAELQVLASHLRGEADSLAERYAPATRAASPSARDRRWRRRWAWQCVAAGVAGLALLAWRIDRWQQTPPAAPVESIAQTATSGNVAIAPPQRAARFASEDRVARVPLAPLVSSSAPPSNFSASDPASLRHTQGIAEVGIDAPAIERHPPADQVEMLRIQALGFEKVIRKLQAEIVARDTAQIESQRQIQSLQEEVVELHKQLDGLRHSPSAP